ncbi:MAG TPA: hypothetical protein GXX23_00350 [Firmicutes bacterium]|nr:hypothetical protein [Candidatus Fermentithermobacillaceae bacterium]
MLLSAEAFCENAVFFDDTSFIALHLERNGIPLEDTIGSDSFLFNGAILPERRVGATGRTCRHQMDNLSAALGLGSVSVPGPRDAVVGLDLSDDLRLRVKTNLTLDVGVFTKVFSVKLRVDGKTFDIPLSRPDVQIEWVGRGEYLVSLQPFVIQALTKTMAGRA